ncbi:hypothetical protein ACJX0J_023374, partial [Zea mays]
WGIATASSAAAAQAANVMMTTYLIMNVNSEFGPSNWTYGDFRIGKYESCDIWAVYQHLLHWAVYPQEGDIWAVYQHVEKMRGLLKLLPASAFRASSELVEIVVELVVVAVLVAHQALIPSNHNLLQEKD